MILAWICFILAAILLTVEMIVNKAVSLGGIAMVLVALGLAITVWPAAIG
jgi:hypothetical protein